MLLVFFAIFRLDPNKPLNIEVIFTHDQSGAVSTSEFLELFCKRVWGLKQEREDEGKHPFRLSPALPISFFISKILKSKSVCIIYIGKLNIKGEIKF